jgi:hypothetical protein
MALLQQQVSLSLAQTWIIGVVAQGIGQRVLGLLEVPDAN